MKSDLETGTKKGSFDAGRQRQGKASSQVISYAENSSLIVGNQSTALACSAGAAKVVRYTNDVTPANYLVASTATYFLSYVSPNGQRSQVYLFFVVGE